MGINEDPTINLKLYQNCNRIKTSTGSKPQPDQNCNRIKSGSKPDQNETGSILLPDQIKAQTRLKFCYRINRQGSTGNPGCICRTPVHRDYPEVIRIECIGYSWVINDAAAPAAPPGLGDSSFFLCRGAPSSDPPAEMWEPTTPSTQC